MSNETNALALLAECGIAVTLEDVLAGMQSVVQTTAGGDGLPLLKLPQSLGKAGPANDTSWVFGGDSDEIGADDLLRLDTTTFAKGYLGWKGDVPEAHMVSVIGGVMPDRAALPPLGFDEKTQKEGVYVQAFAVEADILTGEHAGTRVRYAPASGGAKKFFGKYASAVLAASAKHSTFVFPVVRLGNEASYLSKFKSHIRNPSFQVDYWTDASGARFGAEFLATEDGRAEIVEVVEEDGAVAASPARRRRRST